MLSKNTFVPFQTLLDNQVEKRKQQEIVDQKILDPLPTSPIVSWMFYIPFINIIGLGFGKTKDKILIRNGLVITIICGIII